MYTNISYSGIEMIGTHLYRGRSVLPYRFLNFNNVQIRVGGYSRGIAGIVVASFINSVIQSLKSFPKLFVGPTGPMANKYTNHMACFTHIST